MLRARDTTLRGWLRLPPEWLRTATGGPTVLEGQVLDPHVQALLFAIRAARIRDSEVVATARRAMDHDLQVVAPPAPALREMRDLRVETADASLPARLYVPATAPQSPPLLVFFHGGGFVVGSIRSHEAAVQTLASDAGVAALSVEYRLAPERAAPTAATDAHAAYLWARSHAGELGCDPSRTGVGGDSGAMPGCRSPTVACRLSCMGSSTSAGWSRPLARPTGPSRASSRA